MFVWNVLPPCAATVAAIALVCTISLPMAAALASSPASWCAIMFRLAAAGRPLHHDFANKAAAVDGEMVDVVSNMPLVRAFGGFLREHRRFDATVDREMDARRRSLFYLEKLRIFHAVVTIVLTLGPARLGDHALDRGEATTGDVVLACTLALSVLHATRDLAVALVDITQHLARLAEAVATLLVPHELRDHPEAAPLVRRGASVKFEHVTFRYGDGEQIFEDFSLSFRPGERVGLVGHSGGGKSTLFALLQRFYDVQSGRILIDGQDIARVTQDSLREAIGVVPQDISLFHRSVMENIRYGRPDATDDEVLEAAIAARCDFIEKLPDGMRTIVGDRGVKLSGGQRQRIAIARAFLKDAPLLLARRSHLGARQRFRRDDPRSVRPPDARSHRHRHRAPAVDGAQFRPHRGAADRQGRPGRPAGSADAPRRALSRSSCSARWTASTNAGRPPRTISGDSESSSVNSATKLSYFVAH